MNYRHAFHAGNFADVHKHLVMIALLERLKRKPTPLLFLDTHAGRGRYDLRSPDALKSGEWRTGIGKLAGATFRSDDAQRYAEIAGLASALPLTEYAGSPLLALRTLRESDRIALVEQQIAEVAALERELPRRRNLSVVSGDGYASLRTFLPPKEKRGLVLIDPPYEADNEFVQVERALQFGLTRWATGQFAVWYPLKASREAQRMQSSLVKSGLRKLLLIELTIRPQDSPLGLNGSGMIIANPPWKFDEEIREALVEVHALLDSERAGSVRVEWLVGE
jgi:23S rRNA (adenine2030-N6)-methyltransferase